MSTLSHIKNRRNLRAASSPALVGLVALIFPSCASVSSTKLESNHGEGIPYSLPQGVINIELSGNVPEDGSPASFVVNASSDAIPDRERTYLLSPSNNAFSSDKMDLTLDDGMLSTINSANTGKADEFISNITQTILNLQKIGAASEVAPLDVASLESAVTTYNKSLSNIDQPKDKQRYNLLAKNASGVTDQVEDILSEEELKNLQKEIDSALPGYFKALSQSTDITSAEKEALIKKLDLHPQVFSAFANDAGAPLQERALDGMAQYTMRMGWEKTTTTARKENTDPAQTKSGKIPGVFVATMSPKKIDLTLSGDLKQILEIRIHSNLDALSQNEKALEDSADDLKVQEAALSLAKNNQVITVERLREILLKDTSGQDTLKYSEALIKWEKQFETQAATQDEIASEIQKSKNGRNKLAKARNKTLESLQTELAHLYLYVGGAEAEKIQALPTSTEVFATQAKLLLPDEREVFIPLKDALIGKTEHKLTLKKGVLVSYSVDRPSSAVELSQVPMEITGKVLQQVTDLIQFKINLTGKKKELTEAEKNLITGQKDLLQELQNLKDQKRNTDKKSIEDEYRAISSFIALQQDTVSSIGKLKTEITKLEVLAKEPTNSASTNLQLRNQISDLQRQVEAHENLLRVLNNRVNSFFR